MTTTVKTHISVSGKRVLCTAKKKACPRGGHEVSVVGSFNEQGLQAAAERAAEGHVEYTTKQKLASYKVYESVMQTLHYGDDIDDDDFDEQVQAQMCELFVDVVRRNPDSQLSSDVQALVLDAAGYPNHGEGYRLRNQVMWKVSDEFQDVNSDVPVGTAERNRVSRSAVEPPKKPKSKFLSFFQS